MPHAPFDRCIEEGRGIQQRIRKLVEDRPKVVQIELCRLFGQRPNPLAGEVIDGIVVLGMVLLPNARRGLVVSDLVVSGGLDEHPPMTAVFLHSERGFLEMAQGKQEVLGRVALAFPSLRVSETTTCEVRPR